MKYKNLNFAFLLEIIIGFGTILSISLMGNKGIAFLALMALRPIFLKRENIKDEKLYWQFSYKIILNSTIVLSLMIISILIIVQFIPVWKVKLPSFEILLVELIPFFLLTHGVMGYINLSILDKTK
jgi:hypothetical protein